MFDRVRRRVARLSGRVAPVEAARDAGVRLHLPSPYGGRPWLTATVRMSRAPSAHGESLRVRAHLDGCLRRPSSGGRERLAWPSYTRGSLTRRGSAAAAALVRGVVDRLPDDRFAALSSQRWRTWLDVQLSTSPLDRGADALLPEPLRRLHGEPPVHARGGQPRLALWSGPAGGPGGIARLALLQLDERDSGDPKAGGKRDGFSLSASVAQVVEPVRGDDQGPHRD